MFLTEEIMRWKVVTSKVAMIAADFDLLFCRYIQIKEVKVK